MAETQLHFIKYAVEEILEYVEKGGKIEEWYQNKLSKVHSDMEGMHSWMEGEKRRTGMVSEEVEQLDELSKSTLGSYIKKSSHDVAAKGAATRQFANDSETARKKEDYMSARKSMEKADKTFSKSWKRREGMAKAVDRLSKESVNEGQNPQVKGGDPCWKGYEMVGMKKKGGKEVPNCVPVKEQVSDAPFDPPYSTRKTPVKDKSGAVHGPMSMAKHLAKTAMKKQKERMQSNPPVKESMDQLDEIMQEPDYNQSIKARQAAAAKTKRKAQIVRDAAKKQKLKNEKTDKFEPEPELNDSIIKSE